MVLQLTENLNNKFNPIWVKLISGLVVKIYHVGTYIIYNTNEYTILMRNPTHVQQNL